MCTRAAIDIRRPRGCLRLLPTRWAVTSDHGEPAARGADGSSRAGAKRRCAAVASGVKLLESGHGSGAVPEVGGARGGPKARRLCQVSATRRRPQANKNPASGGVQVETRILANQELLRRTRPNPASAIPINSSVPGSGTRTTPDDDKLYVVSAADSLLRIAVAADWRAGAGTGERERAVEQGRVEPRSGDNARDHHDQRVGASARTANQGPWMIGPAAVISKVNPGMDDFRPK